MNPSMTIVRKPYFSFFPLFVDFPQYPEEALEPGWAHISTRDEALRALRRAADRDPREYPAGIVLESPLISRGEMICWFESWASLQSALRHVLAPLAGANPVEVSRLKRRLARLARRGHDQQPELKSLRKLFAPALRIHWLGSFAEMRAAEGEFAREAVASFLQMEIQPNVNEVEVPSSYLERFIASLRQNGGHGHAGFKRI